MLALPGKGEGEIEFQRLHQTSDDPGAGWSTETGESSSVEVDVTEAAFVKDFLQLADADDEVVLEFARYHGPLGLCEHGLPMSHIPERALRYVDEDTFNAHHPGVVFSQLHVSESIDDWRRIAGQAAALHRLASVAREWTDAEKAEARRFRDKVERAKRDGEEVPKAEDRPRPVNDTLELVAKDWTAVGEILNNPEPLSEHSLLDELRLCTGEQVRRRAMAGLQMWFEWANLGAQIEWEDTDYPQIRWAADNLFGAITLQLALSMCGTPRFSWCASCQQPFFRKRGPKHGQRQWCGNDECQKEKKRRESKRDRDKRRAGGLAQELAD